MGKGLYKVNNVVDTINVLSISSAFCIGGFDVDKIVGDVQLRLGDESSYDAIGRGILNIDRMIALRDDLGFFGTPTSDSVRTMITTNSTRLLVVYYDFFSNVALVPALDEAAKLIKNYCGGVQVSKSIVK